jgi:hypothetical protein
MLSCLYISACARVHLLHPMHLTLTNALPRCRSTSTTGHNTDRDNVKWERRVCLSRRAESSHVPDCTTIEHGRESSSRSSRTGEGLAMVQDQRRGSVVQTVIITLVLSWQNNTKLRVSVTPCISQCPLSSLERFGFFSGLTVVRKQFIKQLESFSATKIARLSLPLIMRRGGNRQASYLCKDTVHVNSPQWFERDETGCSNIARFCGKVM